MDSILWIAQICLALIFVIYARIMLSPPAALPEMLSYIHDLPPSLRRFIALMEILATIGLILPALTNILPILTPLAAVGLVILMGVAATYHIPRREYPNVAFNLLLLALALFVAYGRFVLVPF